jgi:peptidoglycan-associated lipoprotein
MNRFAACLAVALIAAGCASKEKQPDAAVTDRSTGTTAPSATTTPGTSSTTPRTTQSVTGNPLTDPGNILSKRSVYFDFDSNAVKDEYRNMIQAHARYLNDNRSRNIRIEGNCDERGSREYNLALGQRRAESVKKVMTVLGVQDGRIETTSYGEEKPKNPGHDEAAWAENRRADIRYNGE